ncbi:hypothetical protein SBF1_7060001 [Candidatus Desulfosporosinus infrequens]|uniref:Uncharacterized protein n=1 Tax=Candidatus Desulfosporosinus infrequens TaxID=2043169 RepID=A0A2U3LPU7_9FIRM|nr:hypothetical protein SBF1_7060001 [Candidatus Desulfosporosinus infrequens]
MAAKNWSIQDSKRKSGNIVEFWLAYKQDSAPVVVTFTNDKLADMGGVDNLPQYIMTEMQRYLASISVFRCRCLGLCKYCVKPEGEGTTFSSSGVCKHYSGLACNVSAGDITIKNNPKGYKEMDHCKIAVTK